MSTEDEIQEAKKMVEDIELYVKRGVWNPDRNSHVAKEIVEAGKSLNQLMVGHSMKIDILSQEQVLQVSDLLKRLNKAKDKLPSPPWS